ncbi:hypothetical protein PR048_003228 [Dryococelus australis]|uniref:HTH psq-type domain-containing protein n=1 Tax=Dryococelus australis TaxID=614101 RepID=A0ABQ9IMD9_9NEOP|nr:hypothetical protein PR048_003228 [Dryococelus australis]
MGWSEESMRKAIEEVVQKTMGYRKAVAAFNVPQTTLERKMALFRHLISSSRQVWDRFSLCLHLERKRS